MEPSAAVQRYLEQVVEGLNLCPYARRSRLDGHVVVLAAEAGGDAARHAAQVAEASLANPRLEAVLLAFPLSFAPPAQLEEHLRAFRAALAGTAAPSFYAVMFHPQLAEPGAPSPSPESFVASLRRSPVPFIQCLRADVMDAVRRQAQAHAERELARLRPGLEHQLGRGVSTLILPDPVLSSAIARENFARYANGPGRAELERRLRAVEEAVHHE